MVKLNVIIKKIKKYDKDIFNKISKLSKEWEEENISYGWKADSVKYLKKKIIFIAKIKDTIIGFAYGSIKRNRDLLFFKHRVKYAELEAIYIKKQYRENNIGGMLLNAFIDYCRRRKAKYIYAVGDNKNVEKLINFYLKNNFKIVHAKFVRKL